MGKETRRFGIISTAFFPLVGGAERQCLRLARWLGSRRELAWVLTLQIDPATPRTEELDGVTISRIGPVAMWRRVVAALGNPSVTPETSYERALRQNGLEKWISWTKQSVSQLWITLSTSTRLWRDRRSLDSLICFFFSPLEAIACRVARLLNIPVIVRATNSDQYLFLDLIASWQRRALLRADRIVAISGHVRKQIVALGVDESRITLIPNGVDLPAKQWEVAAAHVRAAVCVANLSQQPLKGLDVLIEAWGSLVKEIGQRHHLMICGRGDSTTLAALARGQGVQDLVTFAGFVVNVEPILLESSLFVLPSRFEGMSNALLEAMALGMPCVSTAVSGSTDLIESGRNGILVPVDNPIALAEALIEVLGNKAMQSRLGIEARRTI